MPWTTPNLRAVREAVRGEITTSLGRASFVGNSVLRVIADATAALCHLTLKYIDWLSLQLLPDTAETEWLDRHGDIWLVNADGSVGRKAATLAQGTMSISGSLGFILPSATQFQSAANVLYETTEMGIFGSGPLVVPVIAITAGTAGNVAPGEALSIVTAIAGIDSAGTVIELSGGTDEESDDDLRARVLRRIRQPPMGGAAYDYEAWALAVPGVTRAWCAAQEMGIGTVTVRFMMDDLRADNGGFPLQEDIDAVTAYLDIKRPVTVKDLFVVAPLPQPIDVVIVDLVPDTPTVRGAIEHSITELLMSYAAPGQTIYAAWKTSAVMATPGVMSFDMGNFDNDVMESPGHMAVLGDIVYNEPTATLPAGALPLLV